MLDIVHDLLRRDLGGVCDDVGPGQVGAGIVGRRDADDGRLVDRRVRVEQLLELGGADLQALVLQELLLSVDDEELAALAHGNVARAEPGFVERVSRRGLVVEVASHDCRAADEELAGFAVVHIVEVVVDESAD